MKSDLEERRGKKTTTRGGDCGKGTGNGRVCALYRGEFHKNKPSGEGRTTTEDITTKRSKEKYFVRSNIEKFTGSNAPVSEPKFSNGVN